MIHDDSQLVDNAHADAFRMCVWYQKYGSRRCNQLIAAVYQLTAPQMGNLPAYPQLTAELGDASETSPKAVLFAVLRAKKQKLYNA